MIMKKIILVLAAVLLVCASAGCIAEEEEESALSDKYIHNDVYDGYRVYIYVDEYTGVEYLIYSDRGMNAGFGGICPRYNTDGTLKINEEFRK